MEYEDEERMRQLREFEIQKRKRETQKAHENYLKDRDQARRLKILNESEEGRILQAK